MHCENHEHQNGRTLFKELHACNITGTAEALLCTRASAAKTDTCARAPERHGRGPAPLSERLSVNENNATVS